MRKCHICGSVKINQGKVVRNNLGIGVAFVSKSGRWPMIAFACKDCGHVALNLYK